MISSTAGVNCETCKAEQVSNFGARKFISASSDKEVTRGAASTTAGTPPQACSSAACR